MDDGKYDDLIGPCVEVDRVRESAYDGTTCLAVDARVRERCLKDAGKRPVDLCGKGAAKPRTLLFVPVTGIQ